MSKQIKTERMALLVDHDWLARLDQWRRAQDDLPTRSEAIRRIVDAVTTPPKE